MALLPFFRPSTLRDEAQTVIFSLVNPSLAKEPTAGRRVGYFLALASTLSSAWSLLHLDSCCVGLQPQTTTWDSQSCSCTQTEVTIKNGLILLCCASLWGYRIKEKGELNQNWIRNPLCFIIANVQQKFLRICLPACLPKNHLTFSRLTKCAIKTKKRRQYLTEPFCEGEGKKPFINGNAVA